MALNSETLERILFDRSLGELAPDVEALLRDYLADRPQAGRLAEAAEQTVALARRALGEELESAEVALPPPSFLHGDGLALPETAAVVRERDRRGDDRPGILARHAKQRPDTARHRCRVVGTATTNDHRSGGRILVGRAAASIH
jgi:hypothetical protein